MSAEAALAHLRDGPDRVMAELAVRLGPEGVAAPRSVEGLGPLDHFSSLARIVLGQQLSVAVARSLWTRMLERYDGPPTPAQVLADDPEAMRPALGLSKAKTAFIIAIAEAVEAGLIDTDAIDEMSDEEIQRTLVAVKGIGPWTAQIFLMFHLGRPDVLPVGDLGVQRAVERAYGLPKLPTPAELTALAEPWRPYRTIASRLLWHSLDNAPAA